MIQGDEHLACGRKVTVPEPRASLRRYVFLVAILFASAFHPGCETAVDPVIETDIPFTIYGLFNPSSDTQAVRVFPVDGVLERTSDRGLGAVVTSTNLDTGVRRTWADSIIAFPGREIGHVYWSRFNVGFDEPYHLEVVRADGAKSEVVVTTPPPTTAEVGEGDFSNSEFPIDVLWRGAPNLIGIVVKYRTNIGIYTREYGVSFQREDPEGRIVSVQFLRDTRQIFIDAFFLNAPEVNLAAIELGVVVTNEEWVPPDGRFDPDFLVEPGVFSNVSNGFGFVGAGYRNSVSWLPSDRLQRIVGFTPDTTGSTLGSR